MRLYMYEQYSVILAALVLGTLSGVFVASMITLQFYMFLELPFRLEMPWVLIFIMSVIALTTTGYAVY